MSNIETLNIPIYNALKDYTAAKPIPFHMPGHKLGKGFPEGLVENMALLDMTEIPGTDNLHFPNEAIKEAQELAAKAFEADETFFLVNGSTCGIHAMIMTICRPGDKLIVARDCHKSVIGGMILAGVKPVYINPQFDSIYGIPTVIRPQDIENALQENSDAVGVFLTRPNYYGLCSDIKAIAKIVHLKGKILAVDEAHGAHLIFSSSLPVSSMEAEADICVQSAHKTLPALTQGAYLHVKMNRIDAERLRYNLRLLQTTSPSYIILAFLDIARAIMQGQGSSKLEQLLKTLHWFREKMGQIDGIRVFSNKSINIENAELDGTRLVINIRSLGLTGFEAERILRKEYNIQVEMSNLYNLVCITTISDTTNDFEKLCASLKELAHKFKKAPALADIYIRGLNIPEQRMELKDTVFAGREKIKLCMGAGRIGTDMITPYPPGVPVICPGEVITGEAVEYISNIVKSGGTVTGVDEDMQINVLKQV